MFKVRSDLAAMLDRLESELPKLQQQFPADADFWAAFCGHADGIEDLAAVSDFGYVRNRIDAMLASRGGGAGKQRT